MLVLTGYGLQTLLGNCVGTQPNYLWYVHLYINDHFPNAKDIRSCYIEPDFGGYERRMMMNWKVTKDGLMVKASAEEVVWNLLFDLEVELPVFGYFVSDYGGEVVWAERFTGAPFKIKWAGSTISVLPQLKM
jgi:hypothetical protein